MSEARSHAFASVSVPEAYDRFMARQLFGPWARELVRRAGMRTGDSVLDVACGPGTVAHLAATQVGEAGRVVASDISAAMLAVAAAKPAQPGSAPIEYLECPVTALETADASFPLVFCQHGLQFFADRLSALGEIHRSLEPGGVVLVSTWAAEYPLGLFGPIADAMRELGIDEPYPRAFDSQSYVLGASELGDLLRSAGFRHVAVETVELDCTWDTTDDALATVSGTPFGPLVATLPAADQEKFRSRLLELLGNPAEQVTVRTASNIARGVK
ncbi:MAG: class I SAM-dependent methyltransferase [Solirubrobacteraceae bacterium]